MPMLSQGMVTPGERHTHMKVEVNTNCRACSNNVTGHGEMQLKSHLCAIYIYIHIYYSMEQLYKPFYVLTRHSTQMPQNGSRVIGEDSEVPSMSEEKIRANGHLYVLY